MDSSQIIKLFLWRITTGLLLLITLISGTVYWLYHYSQLRPLHIQGKQFNYTVKPGASLNRIARDLAAQGIFSYPIALTWVLKARYQQQAHLLKAGDYAIPVGANAEQLLQLLIAGRGVQYTLTIQEGWTFKRMLEIIHQHPKIKGNLEGLDANLIMAQLGYPDQHPEGRFYPDTYHFAAETTDLNFLHHAYDTMQKKLKVAWGERQTSEFIKTPYDALILASIIEKETADKDEYAVIAGVFTRRLQKKMRLQTDPTVIYGMGADFKGNLRRSNLKQDTPYNTYVHHGLPPTPIALPGLGAIKAALNPANGKSLYFVAKGNGSHYFSKNLREHNCAILRYQLKPLATKKFKRRCQTQH